MSALLMYLISVVIDLLVMNGESYCFAMGVIALCIHTLLFIDYVYCLYLVRKMETFDQVIKK